MSHNNIIKEGLIDVEYMFHLFDLLIDFPLHTFPHHPIIMNGITFLDNLKKYIPTIKR